DGGVDRRAAGLEHRETGVRAGLPRRGDRSVPAHGRRPADLLDRTPHRRPSVTTSASVTSSPSSPSPRSRVSASIGRASSDSTALAATSADTEYTVPVLANSQAATNPVGALHSTEDSW